MKKFYSINRTEVFETFQRGTTRSSFKIFPCPERTLVGNDHVRGFSVDLDEGSDVLVEWRMKSLRFFPNEVQAALGIAAALTGRSAEAEGPVTFIGVDPMGGAEDYVLGNTQVHYTCRGKMGVEAPEQGYHYMFLPPVRREEFGSWLSLVRLLQRTDYNPPFSGRGVISPWSVQGEIGDPDPRDGVCEAHNLTYNFEGKEILKIDSNVYLRGYFPCEREEGEVDLSHLRSFGWREYGSKGIKALEPA
ncbi:MAG: hypothetical protein KBC15_02975 [Candidatus Levybacteria bacterium]|nr:hypothetical protein [Candidatus Levybacteria bacterium]